jgi:hypothetical protein
MRMNLGAQPSTNKHGAISVMPIYSSRPMPTRSMLVSSTIFSNYSADHIASNAWGEDAGTLHNDAWPLQILFHSYDPIMAITDDTDNIWYVLNPLQPLPEQDADK